MKTPINISTEETQYLSCNPKTGILVWKVAKARIIKAGDTAGHKNKKGYVNVGINGKVYRANRLCYFIYHGENPEQVDHINGIRHDNRKSNLRACTSAENTRNQKMRSTNKSGISGVFWATGSNKWKSKITINYQSIHLGYFKDIKDAIKARKDAEIKYFGEFRFKAVKL